jgi:hypothetical protein
MGIKYDVVVILQAQGVGELNGIYHEYSISCEKEMTLDFHPNKSDKIFVEPAYWSIKEINVMLEGGNHEIFLHKPCSGIAYRKETKDFEIAKRLVEDYETIWKKDGWQLREYHLGTRHVSYDDVLKDCNLSKDDNGN